MKRKIIAHCWKLGVLLLVVSSVSACSSKKKTVVDSGKDNKKVVTASLAPKNTQKPAEASRQAAEEASRQAAEEASRQAAEEASRQAAEEASAQAAAAEEAAKQQAAAEEAAKQQAAAEEAAKQQAAAEEAAKQQAAAEEEARQQAAAEEAARQQAASQQSTFPQHVQRVVELVNQQRAANGLGALTASNVLCQMADVRAKELAQVYDHVRPDGRDCLTIFDDFGVSYMTAGENISSAFGMEYTPDMVMNNWMNSTYHRENILRAKYTQIGVGRYIEGDTTYWVQIFLK